MVFGIIVAACRIMDCNRYTGRYNYVVQFVR